MARLHALGSYDKKSHAAKSPSNADFVTAFLFLFALKTLFKNASKVFFEISSYYVKDIVNYLLAVWPLSNLRDVEEFTQKKRGRE